MKRPGLTVALTVVGVLLGACVGYQALVATGALSDTPSVAVSKGWSLIAAREVKDYKTAAKLARSALDRNPLQSNAASLLAIISEQKKDDASAMSLMSAATKLNRRDDIADYWLFDKQLKTGRFQQAVLHADAIMRRQAAQVQYELYARMLMRFDDPAMIEAVTERLVKRPDWRSGFLHFGATRLTDPRSAFIIYSALQKAGSPPTAQELKPYFERLIAGKYYDEAYLSWVLFLPQETVSRLANIYDGDFEGWPDTAPFGWNLGSGVRGSIESAAAYDGDESALRVDFDGLSAPRLPGQILILTPGNYVFRGKMLTANRDSAGRMEWTLSCDDAPSLLPSQPVADTKGKWRSFAARFTVPEGCKGQKLELKPLPGGQRANIEVWYDDLSIDRADN